MGLIISIGGRAHFNKLQLYYGDTAVRPVGEVKKKKKKKKFLKLSGVSYFGKVRETSYLNFDRGSSDFQVGFSRRVSVRLYALAGFQAEKEISVSGALAAMTQRSSYMSSLFEKQQKKKKKKKKAAGFSPLFFKTP